MGHNIQARGDLPWGLTALSPEQVSNLSHFAFLSGGGDYKVIMNIQYI